MTLSSWHQGLALGWGSQSLTYAAPQTNGTLELRFDSSNPDDSTLYIHDPEKEPQ